MRQKEGVRAQPLKEVGGRDDTVIEKKRIKTRHKMAEEYFQLTLSLITL